MESFILSLDQGTTSSRAIVFDQRGTIVSMAQQEFPQILPSPGVVEHDAEAIWNTQVRVAEQALSQGHIAAEQVAALGITNQRETVVLWERDSGKPVDHAQVWMSRVSAPICERLKASGHDEFIRDRTGLLIDPYFSATKICHLLEKHEGLRARAARGEILFGTIDSFLIWRLTEGKRHVTDVSNASRTMLFNIHTMQWDDDLLSLLDIPRAMLPEVCDSSCMLGETTRFGATIPITGCAGDQQAATFGQICYEPGDAKNTYGTGCFMLMNIGHQAQPPGKGLLTTVGWRIGGKTTYCLEGSVFVGGAVVQWLRDGLKLIGASAEVETLAAEVDDTDGVYFVPAFVGLGAPYWDPYARGTIVGITRGTTASHLALAAIESMAYQSQDVLAAMTECSQITLERLRVDGGATANARMLQFQADLLGVPVERPQVSETTALGAAYLAGLHVGYWSSFDELRRNWQLSAEFHPTWSPDKRQHRTQRWQEAVRRSMRWDLPADAAKARTDT